MIQFANGHADVIRASALGIFFLTGWLESAVFKMKTFACATWFGGLAALTAWIIYPLTLVRFSVGVIVFAFGLLGLMAYYKEPKPVTSKSSNGNYKVVEPRPSTEEYKAAILAYQGLPAATAVSLIAVFLVIAFWGGGSYALSGFAAGVPSVVLLRRWALVGRRIDGWGCPKCAQRFPKNMTWSYPPHNCSNCGEKVW